MDAVTDTDEGRRGAVNGGERFRPRMSDGILLLLITAAGYAISYRFQAGYLAAYGIPPEYVDVSAVALLRTGMHIILLIGGGLAAGYLLRPIEVRLGRFEWLCFPVLLIAVLVVAALVRFPASEILFVAYAAAALSDELTTHDHPARITPRGLSPRRIMTEWLFIVAVIIWAFLMGFYIGRSAGERAAHTKLTVALEPLAGGAESRPTEERALLVVQPQADRWLCVEIELPSGRIEPRVRLVDPATLTAPAVPLRVAHVILPDRVRR